MELTISCLDCCDGPWPGQPPLFMVPWSFHSLKLTCQNHHFFGALPDLIASRESVEGWIDRAQRIFRAVRLLYDTIMMDTCLYTFVQTHRMCITKSEPYCELWTLGDNGKCRFINCSKYTTLVRDVEMLILVGWGWCAYLGAGRIWECLSSSQFCCKPKTAQGKLSLHKKPSVTLYYLCIKQYSWSQSSRAVCNLTHAILFSVQLCLLNYSLVSGWI